MGTKTPDPPTPPDPTVVAKAQSDANVASATAQQKLNMVNSYGPSGSSVYSPDASAPGGYAQTTTLSPGQQGLYDLGLNATTGAYSTANDQIGRINTALDHSLTPPSLQTSLGNTDFSSAVQGARDAAYGQATSRLDPQWGLSQDRLQTQLSNQGLNVNDAAYQNAMGEFGRNKNDAYNQANYSAYGAGLNAQNQGFNQANSQMSAQNAAQQGNFQNVAYAQNQPINQLSALLSSGQVSTPQGINYTPSAVAPTDVTGAYALNTQAQNANYQARMANSQSGLGGLFNLGSAALTAWNPLAGAAMGGAKKAGLF